MKLVATLILLVFSLNFTVHSVLDIINKEPEDNQKELRVKCYKKGTLISESLEKAKLFTKENFVNKLDNCTIEYIDHQISNEKDN